VEAIQEVIYSVFESSKYYMKDRVPSKMSLWHDTFYEFHKGKMTEEIMPFFHELLSFIDEFKCSTERDSPVLVELQNLKRVIRT